MKDLQRALHKAAQKGNSDQINSLLAAGAKVNGRDVVDKTALMQAANAGHVDCVTALIAAGADVNAQEISYCKKTALMYAVEKGSAECVTALVAAGANVNVIDHVGRFPLLMAVTSDDAKCVKLLIDAGADVNGRDQHGTPVIKEASITVRRILLAAGAKRDFSWVAPLVGWGLTGIFLIFGTSAFIHWTFQIIPLWGAVILGFVVAAFLATSAISVIDRFLDIYLTIGSWTLPSPSAAKSTRTLWTWIILASFATIGTHIYNPSLPIWAVCLTGVLSAPIVSSLTLLLPEPLPSGANLETRNHLNQTPLMVAAKESNVRRLKALIRKGADVNAQKGGFGDNTALMYAVEEGSAECVRALVAAGANANIRDHLDKTACMIATEAGRADCLTALIAAGADVNAQESRYCEYTALIYAVKKGSAECVRVLVAAGADFNAKDHLGDTALDHAKYDADILAILRTPKANYKKASSGLQLLGSFNNVADLLHEHDDGESSPSSSIVRYRGVLFSVAGEYDLIHDDNGIVRGIWYRDPASVRNRARNRMVAATASLRGLTLLDSDYETTIVGGVGGVEELTRPIPPVPGGAILWFASSRGSCSLHPAPLEFELDPSLDFEV